MLSRLFIYLPLVKFVRFNLFKLNPEEERSSNYAVRKNFQALYAKYVCVGIDVCVICLTEDLQ